MKLKRGKPLEKWTPAEVAADVESAFYGDSDQRHVPAAIVLRYAFERLPKADAEIWMSKASAGNEDRGVPTHGVFKFGFDDEDRVALYMDHSPAALVREVEVAFDLSDAVTVARQWTGDKTTEASLANLPGVYQAALFEAVTGVSRFWNELKFSWYLPGDGEYVPFRKYPPEVGQPVEFMLMPRAIGEALYRASLKCPIG